MSAVGAGALMHALDIEVRIEALEGKEPAWAQKEEEAGNWIFDTVHVFVRDVFSGRVQVDRDRIEANSFTRTLAVFALPTSTHASILQSDTSALAARLATDLAAKFGVDHKTPKVSFTPIRAFISEASPMNAGAAQNPGTHGPSHQSPYGATQMWNNAPPQSPQQPQGPAMMPAPYMPQLFPQYAPPPPPDDSKASKSGPWLGPTGVMLMGIVLGGFAISTGVLAMNQYRTAKELEATKTELASANRDNASYVAVVTGGQAKVDEIQQIKERIAKESERKKHTIEIKDTPRWENVYMNNLMDYEKYLLEREAELAKAPEPGRRAAPTVLPGQTPCVPGIDNNKPECRGIANGGR